MGLVNAEIELINALDAYRERVGEISTGSVRQINVTALVDSGAYFLAINERIQEQLGLPVIRKAPAALANGTIVDLEIAGSIEVRFENRMATVDAMVLPGDSEVLLGAIPMEAMDVLIDPRKQRLIVNPEHPIRPQYSLK
jgi:clan AA aspartic protease